MPVKENNLYEDRRDFAQFGCNLSLLVKNRNKSEYKKIGKYCFIFFACLFLFHIFAQFIASEQFLHLSVESKTYFANLYTIY